MNINMVNGIMFIIAGLTPFILYLGLGPDGLGFFNQARTEQLFANLYFSLPIAFLMTRRIESNYFVDSGFDFDVGDQMIHENPLLMYLPISFDFPSLNPSIQPNQHRERILLLCLR